MARKKVKLAYITNDSARRATFKKRKRGLIKKVSELSTLCGVSACAIVYGPYERQPEIWPSPVEAHRVLMKFKSLPEMEQSKKMMNQEVFLWNRIIKVREQLKKQQRDNRYKEIAHLMYQSLVGKSLYDLNTDDLSDLAWMIAEKSKEIEDRMDDLVKQLQIVPVANPNRNRNPNPNINVNTNGGGGGSVGTRHPPPAVQNTNTIAATNHNTGININVMGGDQRHQYQQHQPQPQPQQQVVAGGGGMNIVNAGGGGQQVVAVGRGGMNAGGGGQQVVRQPPPVDPMLAAMDNLQRQNWFTDMNMNTNPNPHRDPMVSGGYNLGAVVGHDHLQQMQLQMQMLGMAPSTSAAFGGGVAENNNNNININTSAAGASGWVANNNPFFG